MPMFYHFEFSDDAPNYWGLTDSFLAGISALACATAILGATRPSWGWTVLSALLAGLAFLTKPAGLLVMAAVIGTWFIFAIATGWAARPRSRGPLADWRTLCTGAIAFALVCGPIVLAGFRSSYFSIENFAYADRALTVLAEDWVADLSISTARMVQTSLGFGSILALAASIIAGVHWLRTATGESARTERALIVACLLAVAMHMAAGLWFFAIKMGGSQIRYFYPFALMTMVCIIPVVFGYLNAASFKKQNIARAILLILPLNLTILLAQSNPPPEWQRLSGVNLGVRGTVSPELLLGRRMLATVRQHGSSGKPHSVYFAGFGERAEIDGLWDFEHRSHPKLPNITTSGPIDWQRSSTFRISEITGADFILFPPVRDQRERSRRLSVSSVEGYSAEQTFFEAWFSQLDETAGVQVFGETDHIRALRVVDRDRLGAALDALKRSRHWGATFTAANPQLWWSEDEVSKQSTVQGTAASGIRFGGLFRIAALSLKREGNNVNIELWWDKNKVAPLGNWFFFAHLVDLQGTIVLNTSIPLTDNNSYTIEAPLRFDALSMKVPTGTAAKGVAFGIYRAEAGRADMVPADSGNRDWNDHRVVVPLP
ncbi:hypothetical protein ASE63_18310 [Bosea sp. Root381]|nr:hypothetical protein ASE63_18310 [Bosea sp. Root381]